LSRLHMAAFAAVVLATPAFSQSVTSHGDCGANFVGTTVQGNINILCNRYKEELKPLEKLLQDTQKSQALSAARMNELAKTLNGVLAPLVEKYESSTATANANLAKEGLHRSLTRIENLIRENRVAVADNPATLTDLTQRWEVVAQVIRGECTRLQKDFSLIHDTMWERCEVHVARLPKLGITPDNLMSISLQYRAGSAVEVGETVAAASAASAELDRMLQYSRSAQAAWLDRGWIQPYAKNLGKFCAVVQMPITLPKCPYER